MYHQLMLTVKFVDHDSVVTFSRTQSVLVDLVLEIAGAEAHTQHAVLYLITLPGTSLQHIIGNIIVSPPVISAGFPAV